MGAKKVRVTNELIQKLDKEGVESMSRKELRALFRKGYIERRIGKMDDGSLRYGYRIAPNILVKEV